MLTHAHGQPRTAGFFRSSASSNWRPRRATRRGPAEPIPQAPALPVVAPAAVGQGPVAADSLHRRLHAPLLAPRAAAEAALGSALARCGPGLGAGGGLYHSPPNRGVTPLRLCQWLGRAGCGDPGPRGPLPRAESRGGAAAAAWTAYLFTCDVCSTSPWQPFHLFRRH